MRTRILSWLLPAALAVVAAGCSESAVSVTSPDGKLKLNLSLDDGQAVISIDRQGVRLVENSPIGFEFEEGTFGKDVQIKGGKQTVIVEDFDMPVGKTSHVHSVSNQRTVTLKDASGRSVEMSLRAFDDGVAFRYFIPGGKDPVDLKIKNEILQVKPTGNPMFKAMYLPSFLCSHEAVYVSKPLKEHAEGTIADMPALLYYPDGTQIAMTEAMVVDYAGMDLEVENGIIKGKLSPRLDLPEYSVISDSPVRTPWRVFLISDRPGDLLESNVLTALCDPCKETDLSWLNPGKSSWPWWNGYQAPASAYKGDINTINFNINKYYIDFCAENGITYHSITGLITPEFQEIPWFYNEGSTTGKPKDTDMTSKAYPGFDIEKVCEYAREKGVKMRVWVHWKPLSKDIEGTFKQFREWGIDGMMVDYMDRDDQEMIAFQKTVLELAMKYHLHIQFHGASKPSGLQRTYPCEFTRENTLNYEVYKWDHAREMGADHDLDLPFTRCLAGPTDYHLGGFRAVTASDFKPDFLHPTVTSTRSHMLAMYVVYESALQLVSDSPEAYKDQPGFEFIKEVPTIWDETRVLQAEVDGFIVVARRKGSNWFVGGIGNHDSRNISLPLAFLGNGDYCMELFRDAEDSEANPNHLEKIEKKVSPEDTIELTLAPSGGFAAKFSPAGK